MRARKKMRQCGGKADCLSCMCTEYTHTSSCLSLPAENRRRAGSNHQAGPFRNASLRQVSRMLFVATSSLVYNPYIPSCRCLPLGGEGYRIQ